MDYVNKIIDTHAHYDDKAFDADRDTLLNTLYSENIGCIVNISTNLVTMEESRKLAEKYPFIYTSVGFHPDDTMSLDESGFKAVSELARAPKTVAVGEIGLDYYWDKTPRDLQAFWFRRQIELAVSLGLPISIHSREAAKDTFDILHEYYSVAETTFNNKSLPKTPGVLHCFSYSAELAAEAVKMNFMLGIGGVITFKNAKKLVQVVEQTPLDMLVLETDCPYLAPVPYRGERNNSGYLSLVASRIAQIKGLEPEEVIRITTENARRLFPKIV